MVKKWLISAMACLCLLAIAVASPVNQAEAQQGQRSIVPYPRGVQVETVDPVTKQPKNSFCIGVNTIDVKLTNNSESRTYVYVVNRDTSGIERTLYSGWLDPGTHYLSTLLGTQLELVGPAGTEMLRVDSSNYGQITPGNRVSFYVRDCGGTQPGPWPGYAQLWARVYPYAIEQGKKGTITLQTSVQSRPNMTYYFEILNSWDQLWKRLPVSKRPSEQYHVTLPVGNNTKPGVLTYTVNLWLESGFTGERRKVATTQFSFQVVRPGETAPQPYSHSGYPGPSQWNPYGGSSSSGLPYNPSFPYASPQSMYPYGTGFQFGTQEERAIY
jgi:hypothetical protein